MYIYVYEEGTGVGVIVGTKCLWKSAGKESLWVCEYTAIRCPVCVSVLQLDTSVDRMVEDYEKRLQSLKSSLNKLSTTRKL